LTVPRSTSLQIHHFFIPSNSRRVTLTKGNGGRSCRTGDHYGTSCHIRTAPPPVRRPTSTIYLHTSQHPVWFLNRRMDQRLASSPTSYRFLTSSIWTYCFMSSVSSTDSSYISLFCVLLYTSRDGTFAGPSTCHHSDARRKNKYNNVDQYAFLRIDNNGKYSMWQSNCRWNINSLSSNQIWTHLVRITKSVSPRCSVRRVRRVVDNTSTGRQHWRLRVGNSESDEPMSGFWTQSELWLSQTDSCPLCRKAINSKVS
jgi:hypothetical protein